MKEFANPAMSAPVTYSVGGEPVVLQPSAVRAGAVDAAPRTASWSPRSTPKVLRKVFRPAMVDAAPTRRGRRHRRDRDGTAAGRAGEDGRHRRLPEGRAVVPRAGRRRGGEARARGADRRRAARADHQGGPRARHRREGLGVHDLLPARRLPQREHRPRRGADRRHAARAGRDVQPQRHRRRADRGERLRRRASSSATASSRRTSAVGSRRSRRPRSTRRSSPASRTSSTSRTRSTSTATRSAARRRSPGRWST